MSGIQLHNISPPPRIFLYTEFGNTLSYMIGPNSQLIGEDNLPEKWYFQLVLNNRIKYLYLKFY